jgi:molecular chaperone GrpE
MDDLERALQDQPSNEDSIAWAEGIEMIHLKLKAILESENVEPIEGQGQPFDPLYHEAISYEESDEFANSEIIEVVQKGYKLGDRVLRPAMVRVAK